VLAELADRADEGCEPPWVDGGRPPAPGDPDYASYLDYCAYEARRDAFWSAHAAGPVLPVDAPIDMTAARSDAELVWEVADSDRLENAAYGAKCRAVSNLALRKLSNPDADYDPEYLRRSVEAELGCLLKLSPAAVQNLCHVAMELTRRYRKTFAALERGEVNRVQVQAIGDEGADLDVAQASRLEDAVLPEAKERGGRSFRDRVRREVKAIDEDAVRKREQRAREERCVYVRPEYDGMATLCLFMPEDEAKRIFKALKERVHNDRAIQKEQAAEAPLVIARRDERTIAAQELDTIQAILGQALGIDPTEPEIPASSALSAEAIELLDLHADTYAPTAKMKTAVRNRDKHCRFPGCRRPARQCDIDHSIPYKKIKGKVVQGWTRYWNLGCLCRFHHQVKQMPGWHLEQDRGRFIWTTPTGLRFITYPGADDPDAELPDFIKDLTAPVPF
jgi:hypothetical protein